MSSRDARWLAAHECREQVKRCALRAGCTDQEAEDVASEAVVRAALKEDLDLARIHSWLKVVGRNLAIDTLRARPSSTLLSRAYYQQPDEPQPTDEVDDAAEARWLAARLTALAPRQRTVLEHRASGMSAGDVARSMQLSYKTVESLTSRARAELRGALAATLTLVLAAAAVCRRLIRPWPATAAAATAATAAAAFITATPAPAPAPPLERPASVNAARAVVSIDAPRPAAPAALPPRPATIETAPREVPVVAAPVRAAVPDQVVPPVAAAGAGYSGLRHTRSSEDESLTESTTRCLEDGLVVSAGYLGCRAAPPSG